MSVELRPRITASFVRDNAEGREPVAHVILLGDSIFDNAVYVPGEPDVVRQLRASLPDSWRATLLAIDGDVIESVHAQLVRIPADATHLVLSVGGNDALGHVGMLEEPARSSRETLERLDATRIEFGNRYRRLIDAVVHRGLPTAVCTIYEGNFDAPWLQRLASTALTVFNDAILRVAIDARIPVIDLRSICNAPAHYANPIEPSAAGGARIADAVAALVTTHDFATPRTVIYP